MDDLTLSAGSLDSLSRVIRGCGFGSVGIIAQPLFEVSKDDLLTAFKDGKVKVRSGCSAKVEPYKTRSIKKLVRLA